MTNASGLNDFGLDLKFNSDNLTFLGLEQTDFTKDFITVDAKEIEAGIVRVGGYSMGVIQDENNTGILVRLLFEKKGPGGRVEIVEIQDDLKELVVIK